jgi:hypothetical protein
MLVGANPITFGGLEPLSSASIPAEWAAFDEALLTLAHGRQR